MITIRHQNHVMQSYTVRQWQVFPIYCCHGFQIQLYHYWRVYLVKMKHSQLRCFVSKLHEGKGDIARNLNSQSGDLQQEIMDGIIRRRLATHRPQTLITTVWWFTNKTWGVDPVSVCPMRIFFKSSLKRMDGLDGDQQITSKGLSINSRYNEADTMSRA